MATYRVLSLLFALYSCSDAQQSIRIGGVLYKLLPHPTESPTLSPTVNPTTATPTVSPTLRPTANPTKPPSAPPSQMPTKPPSSPPTKQPSLMPSSSPSKSPSASPTGQPTAVTASLTKFPSKQPSVNPTRAPSTPPSQSPTFRPSVSPTVSPTNPPSSNPSKSPSLMPSASPTWSPTMPSQSPSMSPTMPPTYAPSQSPTPYINPYCPVDQVMTLIGPNPPNNAGNAVKACSHRLMRVNDFQGQLQCDLYGCCMCDQVTCGRPGNPCTYASFGDFGAIGVRDVVIDGNPPFDPFSGQFTPRTGAFMDCQGSESCKAATVQANYIYHMNCAGLQSCEASTINLYDPAPGSHIVCGGQLSCANAIININTGQVQLGGQCSIGQILFAGQQSGQGATITINNRGCDKLVIGTIQCSTPDACRGARFVFNGANIEIEDCSVRELGMVPPMLLACYTQNDGLNCNTPQSCSMQSKMIATPLSHFEVQCHVMWSCSALDLTIEPTNGVSRIRGFVFGAMNAAKGAIFKINGQQLQGNLIVDHIICQVAGSCNGLTIIGGANVRVLAIRVECREPDACRGCTLKDGQSGREYPCDPRLRPGAFPNPQLLPGARPLSPASPGAPGAPGALGGAPISPLIPGAPRNAPGAPRGLNPSLNTFQPPRPPIF